MSRKKSIYCIFFTFNTVYCEKPVNGFCLTATGFGALEGYAMKRRRKIIGASWRLVMYAEGHARSWPHSRIGRDGARPSI